MKRWRTGFCRLVGDFPDHPAFSLVAILWWELNLAGFWTALAIYAIRFCKNTITGLKESSLQEVGIAFGMTSGASQEVFQFHCWCSQWCLTGRQSGLNYRYGNFGGLDWGVRTKYPLGIDRNNASSILMGPLFFCSVAIASNFLLKDGKANRTIFSGFSFATILLGSVL